MNLSSSTLFACHKCGGEQYLEKDEVRMVCLDCGFVNSPGSIKNLRDNILENEKNPITSDIITQSSIYLQWVKSSKVSGPTERRLVDALTEITKIGETLNLPTKVLHESAKIYQTLLKKRHLKRLNIKKLCVATVYLACRRTMYPITLGDIEKVSIYSKKDVARYYKFLVKQLNINVKRYKNNHIKYPRALSPHEIKLVTQIMDEAHKQRLTNGRNPASMVASSCYIVCQMTGSNITQRELSEFYRVTQTTIRNRYQELLRSMDITIYL